MRARTFLFLFGLIGLVACEEETSTVDAGSASDAASQDAATGVVDASERDAGEADELGPPREDPLVHSFANGCWSVSARAYGSQERAFLARDGDGFGFVATSAEDATSFHMRASDLATYLLYDPERHFVVSPEGEALERAERVDSDILLVEDGYLPGVQWVLEGSPRDDVSFRLTHVKTRRYLTASGGLSERAQDAALLSFEPAEGCSEFPELTLDAVGTPTRTRFEDGDLFGYVDSHVHIMSDIGFGGGHIVHGASFHPFGVEHALHSCEPFHGEEGRQDILGYSYDNGSSVTQDDVLQALINGETPEPNHVTDGYPTFTGWPNGSRRATHQTMYYRWIERAWLGGMRLMVQHATSNKVLCDLVVGTETQEVRYGCEDMVAVDRIIDQTKYLERYVDAQHGGPGKGWFRIVETPAEAREVVAAGKLAVILGIEVSHLFDCYVVHLDGSSKCSEQDVRERLDDYHARGVRALFPVHKYDNAFSAGDGSRDLIELGNFIQSGHLSSYTTDCPDLPSVFDKGNVALGGLNEPREVYDSEPPFDMSRFAVDPIRTLLRFTQRLTAGPLTGDYCQSHGMTPLGEVLMTELMHKGMIIEVDHFPRRSFERAYEMLIANDYPASASHGNTNRGEVYKLGGTAQFNFGRCNDPNDPKARISTLRRHLDEIEAAGGYPAEGFAFDFNGFSGSQSRPRFGDTSCRDQDKPMAYPFDSYAGDVTFSQPFVGERAMDFDTEGVGHVGMMPELIQDVRASGVTDEDLEPLFRSAEGYLRMWEKAEARGAALRGE